jgi:hypothetical protein
VRALRSINPVRERVRATLKIRLYGRTGWWINLAKLQPSLIIRVGVFVHMIDQWSVSHMEMVVCSRIRVVVHVHFVALDVVGIGGMSLESVEN